RRRHTRSKRDWSSDVCSSDLVGRAKNRSAHVDRNLVIGRHGRLDDSSSGLDADRALVGQSACADELDEAARTVAALLDLPAVGVEDPITKVDVGPARLLHQQDLIAADAEVPVRKPPDRGGPELDLLAHAVEHDEVVAEPLHLGEVQAPGHYGRDPSARSKRMTGISPLRETPSAVPFLSVTVPLSAYGTGSCEPSVISAVASAATSTRPASSTFASPPAGNASMCTLRLLIAGRPSRARSNSTKSIASS